MKTIISYISFLSWREVQCWRVGLLYYFLSLKRMDGTYITYFFFCNSGKVQM